MLGVRPLNSYPLLTLPVEFESQTAIVTVRYSTHSFVTRTTDSPANTPIPGRINSGLRIARTLRQGQDGQFGSILETTFGEIVLNNADGGLDQLARDYYADGRPCRVKIGAKEVTSPTRIMPQLVGEGVQFGTGNAGTNLAPAYPTEGIVAGDFFLAVVTINDRGEGGDLVLPVPEPWQVLGEASNGAVYQAILYHFADGTEAGQAASLDWGSIDGDNDVAVSKIRQFRYVDPDTPISGLTAAVSGDIDSLAMPTVVTDAPNSLAVAVASMSDNVSAGLLAGETGGDWTPSASLASTATGDGASDRIATARMSAAGATISGGTWALTPSGTEESEDSVIRGFALRGLQVPGGQERVQPFSAFATVYQTRAGAWRHTHDELILSIDDLGTKLQDRLQILTYSGTGGRNGPTELAGRTRPLGFGAPSNVTLQLVDPVNFILQATSGSMFAVDQVYDRGAALTFDEDYPTYEDLEAATVASGDYATCLAEGYVKVGGGADPGAITADIQFDEAATHASTIRRIVVDLGPLVAGELDEPSFTAYAAAQPGEIGLFFPAGDETTVEQAVEIVAASGGAFAGQDGSGLYRVKRLEAPGMTVHWAFDERSIVFEAGRRMARREPPYEVPWKSWGLGYGRNWTIQGPGNVAAGVDGARKIYLESEYRYVYGQNAKVALAHGASRPIIKNTLFVDAAAAQMEADRLAALYGLGRAQYEVPVKTALFSVRIGEVARITYSRWGLNQGRNFVIIGAHDDGDTGVTDLVVFG